LLCDGCACCDGGYFKYIELTIQKFRGPVAIVAMVDIFSTFELDILFFHNRYSMFSFFQENYKEMRKIEVRGEFRAVFMSKIFF
jgi:hypothetical protein